MILIVRLQKWGLSSASYHLSQNRWTNTMCLFNCSCLMFKNKWRLQRYLKLIVDWKRHMTRCSSSYCPWLSRPNAIISHEKDISERHERQRPLLSVASWWDSTQRISTESVRLLLAFVMKIWKPPNERKYVNSCEYLLMFSCCSRRRVGSAVLCW